MIENITIHKNITIKEAMKILDRTAEKCLIVVSEDRKLLGTLTDGDIRRSLLQGKNVSSKIVDSYFKAPFTLKEDDYSDVEALEILRVEKLDLIPIVSNNGELIDYLTWKKLGEEKDVSNNRLSDTHVVIMAGGQGVRLQPFTKVLPKPLIPIHDKPIIEHIIDRFIKLGCSNFHITINYKKKILKAYFEDLNPKYNLDFIEEEKPLGTGGSLGFLEGKINDTFIVTNCDNIIDIDFEGFLEHHHKGNYDISLVASAKEYIIPYGTCVVDDKGGLSHINEKPKYDFLINTGLYAVEPKILDLIPKNEFFHITHLIEKVKSAQGKIGVFPIDDESWIDVGQWAEYKKAVDQF